MSRLKKNIWSLFYLILFMGLITLVVILFNVENSIYNSYKKEQENFVKIHANTVSSTLFHYETILDIISNELKSKNNYKSIKKSKNILKNILKIEPQISAFALITPNGKIYASTSILGDKVRCPNFLKRKEVIKTFKLTLEKDTMVLGRTYYCNFMNSFIIPIRKAIRDKEGKVLAVLSAVFKINDAFNLPKETKIFRDLDFFYQLTEHRTEKNLKVYNTQIPKKNIEKIYSDIKESYDEDIELIKSKEKVVTIEYTRHIDKVVTLATNKYINRYNIWIVEQKNKTEIYKDIYKNFSVYILIFIFMYLILFYVFRFIVNIEKNKQKALYNQLNHDELTQLNNRHYLTNSFGKTSLKNSRNFYLFFIDMDNFKNINDSYGHNYGDLILKQISKRLNTFKTDKDILVRYSGDEFIFITYEQDNSKVRALAESILLELSKPYNVTKHQFHLGASIGISNFPKDANNLEDIIRFSDIAMYEAKKKKNTYIIFENKLKDSYIRKSQIEQELKAAIKNDEFYMVYQPQVSKKGKLLGVEALVRWENKKLGFIPPDEFIKIAENSGLMIDIGELIMSNSFKEIKEVQDEFGLNLHLSINISVRQFMDINFSKKIFKQINNIGFQKNNITLEVTENVFIEDINYILSLLNKLRKQNIKISLDDFGTGYSSLSLLRKLPLDELKVDKSFVDDVLYDKDSENMIKTIISIAKSSNLLLVAEGIENEAQKKKLDLLSCDMYQGYYFSKPLSKKELKDYIRNNSF